MHRVRNPAFLSWLERPAILLAAFALPACSLLQPEPELITASKLCKNEPILGVENGVRATLAAARDNLKLSASADVAVYQRYATQLNGYDARFEHVYHVTRTACTPYFECRLRVAREKGDPATACKSDYLQYAEAEKDVRGLIKEIQTTADKVAQIAAKAGADPKPAPAVLPTAPGEEVVGFSGVVMSAPQWTAAAAPYLRDSGISIGELKPKGSRLLLVNNEGLYQGHAVRPTYSQNFLTQVDTGKDPASFELVFAKPVRTVSLTRPTLFAATNSGVTHPAWTAHAFDDANREIAVTSEGLTRSFDIVPAQTYSLVATGFTGIRKIRVDSDFRLDGKPFAGFSAMLIERIATTPFTGPKTTMSTERE
jgi:hypothetical protein